MSSGSVPSVHGRIGLALSGGGFRASLFHLGVIRRLEELGIMEKVSIVSAVSGGSIIAAFYLCEMEKQLREYRLKGQEDIVSRVDLFEKIAGKFLNAVDHNLRTRALVFTPYFHPIRFVKTLALQAFRRGARAELIQAEYDKFFFFNDTMDQLPVERPETATTQPPCVGGKEPFYGPRLLLNTTSLLSGERTPFSRDTSSSIEDLKTSDKNVLPLSRVVGASSGVPVVFPPTAICGDLLVDGGISDNQGIEGLLDPKSGCDVILVSDASGQMQVEHTLSTSPVSVYSRVSQIFQFQIRNKLLELLRSWGARDSRRSFAFIHLLVNLKSRYGSPARVSTEILPALGRIRTDLDQFSPVECEALMYHGYTLIDAQLKQYCCDFLRKSFPDFEKRKLKTPPLFKKSVQEKLLNRLHEDKKKSRDPIREDLEAGSESLYLLRCLNKHFWPTFLALFLGVAAFLRLVWFIFGRWQGAVDFIKNHLEGILYGIVPKSFVVVLDRFLMFFGFKEGLLNTIDTVAHLLALLIVIGLAGYVVSFPVYAAVRWMAMKLDRSNYKKITGGTDPTVHWTDDEETLPSGGPATPPAVSGTRLVGGAA